MALAVVSLLLITNWEYNLGVSSSLFFFVFFGSLTGYNFVKYAEVARTHHRSLTNSLRSIQIFSFIAFVGTVFFAFQQSFIVVLAASFFALLTFLYAVPFIRHKNLRTFSGLKIFVVAIVWAGVSSILPFISTTTELTTDSCLTFFQYLLIVMVLTIPFEIRDLPYDAKRLNTFPQKLGVQGAKVLGVLMLILANGLELFKDELTHTHKYVLIFFTLLSAIALLLSKTKQSKYFSSFWVESIPIVCCVFYYFLK